MTAAKRVSVATGTAPNADDIADVQTPRCQHDAMRPAGPHCVHMAAHATAGHRPGRHAAEASQELDLARLDRATMLAALVELTASNGAIFAALAAKLQELETS
jgi:hypothetical protein